MVNSFTVDVDKLLINRMLGAEAVGIYQLAFALFARVMDLISVCGQILLPKMLKSHSSIFDFCSITLLIGAIATVLSLGLSRVFYEIWLPIPNETTIYVFNVMSLSFVFVALNQLTENELVRRNMQHVNGHIKLIALACFGFF